MKNLYIPKGKILNYESLICQEIGRASCRERV